MKKWFVALLILALLPAFGAGAEAVGDFTVRYMEDGRERENSFLF